MTDVDVAEYPGIRIEYKARPRGYQINGKRVPSVTTVLGLINKPALVYWSAKVTAEGAWKLIRRKGYHIPGDVTKFRNDLRRFEYDHRSVMDQAATRGLDVHDVLQAWAEEQRIPNANKHPEPHRGYIRGLARWLMEWQPRFLESELIVGSAVHGFAGRRDTVAVVDAESLPAAVTEAAHFPEHAKGGGRLLLDLKTSKGLYPNTHYPQLAAYELAGVECGAEPTVAQGIVRVGADGTYEVGWSDAVAEDFLTVLRAYTSQQKWHKRR